MEGVVACTCQQLSDGQTPTSLTGNPSHTRLVSWHPPRRELDTQLRCLRIEAHHPASLRASSPPPVASSSPSICLIAARRRRSRSPLRLPNYQTLPKLTMIRFPRRTSPCCQGTSKLTRSQTSIGTGYDLANAIFSPDGRNFQVEYAIKAVENGGTSLGIRCKDGLVPRGRRRSSARSFSSPTRTSGSRR